MSSKREKFRLGVIGAGAVTSTLHLPGAIASPHVEIVAIADTVVERAQKLAHDYGLKPAIRNDFKDILALVDGVLIATPNHTHHRIAVTCLEAGIPCLVEKPLATTVADADAMCTAAERAGKVLAVGYTTRFRDEVLLLHDLLKRNYFGSVQRFHYQEGTVGGWSPLSGYIADRAASGGGVLTVVGTHFLDRMLYWFGYPKSCHLTDDSKGGPEAHCVANFHYEMPQASFEGTLLLSKTVSLKPGLVIAAERGDVVFPMGRSPLFFRPRENPDLQITLAPGGRRKYMLEKMDAQLEIEDFVAACRDGSPPMVDGRQGLLSVRLLAELYANHSSLAEPWSAMAKQV